MTSVPNRGSSMELPPTRRQNLNGTRSEEGIHSRLYNMPVLILKGCSELLHIGRDKKVARPFAGPLSFPSNRSS